MSQWTILLDGSTLPERSEIGGKGWSVARMAALGLPVPPAFVITTAACNAFMREGDFPSGLIDEIRAGVTWLEARTGRTFGDGPRPLLVAVRSGAAISMPGMMDTVLNLGISARTVPALEAEFDNPDFVRDTNRRFHELYAGIVLKADPGELKAADGPDIWNAAIMAASGAPVPKDPEDALIASVRAVFESWNGRRARRYRSHNNIPDDLGTAVVVQAMVFGNLNDASGTGVMFSRDPISGAPEPFGEFLSHAQGEDVVSGKFTPDPLSAMHVALPEAHAQLLDAARTLENAFGDVQDIEFTVEDGKLYLLQTRSAKRAPQAALRFACDLFDEDRIDAPTALSMVTPDQVRSLMAPRLDPDVAQSAIRLGSGVAACAGVGIGRIVTDSDEAEAAAARGEDVILCRRSTSPDDLHGMLVAKAVITEFGGATSHAAVVGRALGLPSVVGCGDGTLMNLAGKIVTVDGATGHIYEGALQIENPDEIALHEIAKLTDMADALCPITVVLPEDAPADTRDLSTLEGGDSVDALAGLLRGAPAVSGGVCHTPEGVAIAMAEGVRTIVAKPRLPVMLAAISAQNQAQPSAPVLPDATPS